MQLRVLPSGCTTPPVIMSPSQGSLPLPTFVPARIQTPTVTLPHFALTNPRSILNKLDEFQHFSASMNIDVFCLSETWLTADIPDAFIALKNFSIVRRDRVSRGGGVALFVNNRFPFHRVPIPDAFSEVEITCVDIYFDNMPYRIILFYRPGGYSSEALDYFVLSINCITQLCHTNKTICILGDFNLPLINWATHSSPNNRIYNMFITFINHHGFHQFVLSPTRGNSILDIVLSNDNNLVTSLQYFCPLLTSDHDVITFYLNIPITPQSHLGTTIHNFRLANYNAMNLYFDTVNWDFNFQFLHTVNDYYDYFTSHVHYAIDLYVPLKRPPPYHRRTLSKSIRYLYNRKLHHCRLWRTTRSTLHLYRFRALSTLCHKQTKERRHRFENRLLSSNNLKQFYQYVNSKIFNRHSITNLVDDDGNITSDPNKIAHDLNAHFSSVFTTDNAISPNFPQRTSLSLETLTFTPSEVYKSLRSLKASVSVGPDGIPNILLKRCAKTLSTPLAHIFDSSFKDGTLPSIWKTAIIHPALKKAPASKPNNYRPLSMTASTCRAMESIINNKTVDFLSGNNLISSSQHGFRKKRSTTGNLLECVYDWSHALQQTGRVDIIYIDFQKAFDSISHHKLLIKLQAYGISGLLLQWLKQFLQDRTQRVKVASVLSDPLPVSSGVPQGSVLGPTLFNIFINDLPDIIVNNYVKLKLFADDAKLYANHPLDCVSLQTAIDALEQWSCTWQLEINISKSLFCPVSLSRKRSLQPVHYRLASSLLPPSSPVRDLGVLIDSGLSFAPHIDHITHVASVRVKLILRSFDTKNWNTLLRAYTTYVRPLLEYSSPVWNPHHIHLIDQIEAVQRRFTKAFPGLRKLTYPERLTRLNLPTLEHRRLIIDLSTCYKILHGHLSTDIASYLHPSADLNTRGHILKLSTEHCRLDVTKFFFSNRVVSPWNSLPATLVLAPSYGIFRAGLLSLDFRKFLKFHI